MLIQCPGTWGKIQLEGGGGEENKSSPHNLLKYIQELLDGVDDDNQDESSSWLRRKVHCQTLGKWLEEEAFDITMDRINAENPLMTKFPQRKRSTKVSDYEKNATSNSTSVNPSDLDTSEHLIRTFIDHF